MIRPTKKHHNFLVSGKKTPFLVKIRVNLDAKYRMVAANLPFSTAEEALCLLYPVVPQAIYRG
jgi:hypothetical protein